MNLGKGGRLRGSVWLAPEVPGPSFADNKTGLLVMMWPVLGVS